MKNNNLPNGAKREFNVTKFDTTITILSYNNKTAKGEPFNIEERKAFYISLGYTVTNCN
jgi:hypothetical protein